MLTLNPIGSNMTELTIGGTTVLFSYKTPVAARINGTVSVTEKRWSKTTSRHIPKWLKQRAISTSNILTEPQEFFDRLIQRMID